LVSNLHLLFPDKINVCYFKRHGNPGSSESVIHYATEHFKPQDFQTEAYTCIPSIVDSAVKNIA